MKSTRPSIGDWALSTQRRNATADRSGKYHDLRGWFTLAIGLITLWLCASFLKPVIMGAIFATILHPVLMRWKTPRMPQNIRAITLTVMFLIIFLIPFALLIYLGIGVAIEKIALLQSVVAPPAPGQPINPNQVVEAFGLGNWLGIIDDFVPLNHAQIKGYMLRGAQASGVYLTGLATGMFADLPGMAVGTFVIFLTIYFLLMDGPRAIIFIRANSIFSPRKTDELLHLARNLCQSVIVATIMAAIAQSSLVVLSCVLAGLHFQTVLLVGLVSFMASFLPLVGNAPVTVGLILYGLSVGSTTMVIIFIVSAFLVSLADNIVRPLVLSDGAKLHPLIAFVAAFAALDAIGFYGLFIGPIVAGIFFYSLSVVTRSTRVRV